MDVLEILEPEESTVAVTVVDTSDGSPVADAAVTVGNVSDTTDDSGTVNVTVPIDDEYSVGASADEYEDGEKLLELDADEVTATLELEPTDTETEDVRSEDVDDDGEEPDVEDADSDDDATDGAEETPGFGVLVTLLSVVTLCLLAVRVWRRG